MKENKPIKIHKRIFKSFLMKKICFIALLVVLTAAFVLLCRFLYVSVINPKAAFDTPAPTHAAAPTATAALDDGSPAQIPEPTVDPDTLLLSQADLDFLKSRVNMLLLGIDYSYEREDIREDFRTDTMLLLSIDFDNKTVDILSVPRDTYAPIYNTSGRWKINSAFMHGGSQDGQGFEYAMQTVSMLLGGIPISYYAGVQMNTVKEIVDAMGGVDYDIDVPISIMGRKIETGFQHLDGQQVLDYCRARKGISTDIGRIDRQQRLLIEIFNQLQSKEQLVNIPRIYSAMKDNIYTNLSFEQLVALVVFATDIDLETDMRRYTLDGKYIANYVASFYVLYQDKKAETVKEIFGIDIKTDIRYDYDYVAADNTAYETIKKTEKLIKDYADIITADQLQHLNSLMSKLNATRKKNEYS